MQSNVLFINKLEDMFKLVEKNVSVKYTQYLDELELSTALQRIPTLKYYYPQTEVTLWGGYSNADRKVMCVHSTYIPIEPQDFPIKVVQFNYSSNFNSLTHRDFLGAIMSLNVTRSSIGDIVVKQGTTQVAVLDTVADIISNELVRIGRVGVKTSIVDSISLNVTQNFKDINGTVASLRLDCIVSLVTGLSRANAVQLIKSKVVYVNHIEVFSPAVSLKVDDTFSIKGYGKYILKNVSEPTKKGRLHLLVNKYL